MLPFSKPTIALGATVLVLLIVVSSTIYTVSEGYVGIVKRFGKAINQVDPGIHVKIPFVDTVTNIRLVTAKNWNGQLPGTMLGSNTVPLLQLDGRGNQ